MLSDNNYNNSSFKHNNKSDILINIKINNIYNIKKNQNEWKKICRTLELKRLISSRVKSLRKINIWFRD